MPRKLIRIATAAYMGLFAALTTWPGILLINRPRPFIFSLPFNLFALALLILGGMAFLILLYFSENANRQQGEY